MDFYNWWFNTKNEEKKAQHLVKKPIESMPLKSDDARASLNIFSHLPPLASPIFSLDEFSSILKGNLKQSYGHEEQKQRCLEALRIADANAASYINEDNRAAAILSLIGEDEAMIALRAIRWRNGLECPRCGSKNIKVTMNEHSVYLYRCLDCEAKRGAGSSESIFTDLTNIAFAKDLQSVIRWVLICYLKMFCSMGKIAKILNISIDETLQLLSMVNQDESFRPRKKKAEGSFFKE
jgi:transposase-like protein